MVWFWDSIYFDHESVSWPAKPSLVFRYPIGKYDWILPPKKPKV